MSQSAIGFGNLFKASLINSNVSSTKKKGNKKNNQNDKDRVGEVILGNVGKKFDVQDKKQIKTAKNLI